MPQVVSTKLIYISSLNRSFGTLDHFGINIDAQYTKLEDNQDYVSIGMVDAEIRSTWYNVRSSNNKFWIANYDENLNGNVNAVVRPDYPNDPSFYAGPGTRGWYDTPNHQLITIEEGNYNIYELAAAIQNALNAFSNPNSSGNYCPVGAYSGGAVLGAGDTWGTTLVWAVSWNEKTGAMSFSYTGGIASTDIALDFRTKGDFNLYTYGEEHDIDTDMGAFELCGYDRSGYQTTANGQQIPFPYNISTAAAPTGVDNVGDELPSPHPAQIGAPTAIYVHCNLPTEHIGGQRQSEKISVGGTYLDAERTDVFTGSSIFAKIINTYQWFSLISFQSQGEDDYQIYMKDLRYINNMRFWLTDQYGYALKTQHDWSFTLKWTEVRDDTGIRDSQLKEQTELLKLLLIQGEKNKILPAPSEKVLSIGNIWKTKKERMEDEAKRKVEESKATEQTEEMIHKEKEKQLQRAAAHKDVFGDKGSRIKSENITTAGITPEDTSWWVRTPQPSGDGGALFSGENHLVGIHGVNYSYAGPGTKFKERQARGDRGINPLDAAAIPHDRVYQNPLSTPEEIEIADLELQQKAAEIAEKYPEIKQDAKVISGLFDIKDIGVNMGWVDRMLFTAASKKGKK